LAVGVVELLLGAAPKSYCASLQFYSPKMDLGSAEFFAALFFLAHVMFNIVTGQDVMACSMGKLADHLLGSGFLANTLSPAPCLFNSLYSKL
jgi:hypothetical protein